MPTPTSFRWRHSTSPLADPDDDDWIYVEGGGLRQPMYVRIGRTAASGSSFEDSEPTVTGILISNGQQVTSTDLRFPLQRILEQFMRDVTQIPDSGPPRSMDEWVYQASGVQEHYDWLALMNSLPEAAPKPRRRGAPPPTDDELRSFAAVYAREMAAGSRGAVTRAAKAFGMHRVTAHKWIQRCRDAGILPGERTE